MLKRGRNVVTQWKRLVNSQRPSQRRLKQRGRKWLNCRRCTLRKLRSLTKMSKCKALLNRRGQPQPHPQQLIYSRIEKGLQPSSTLLKRRARLQVWWRFARQIDLAQASVNSINVLLRLIWTPQTINRGIRKQLARQTSRFRPRKLQKRIGWVVSRGLVIGTSKIRCHSGPVQAKICAVGTHSAMLCQKWMRLTHRLTLPMIEQVLPGCASPAT